MNTLHLSDDSGIALFNSCYSLNIKPFIGFTFEFTIQHVILLSFLFYFDLI